MPAPNTALPPTRRKSPHTKPNAAGMRQCNRSRQPKKNRSLIKQKKEDLKVNICKFHILNYYFRQ
jgi:hypothetical protein